MKKSAPKKISDRLVHRARTFNVMEDVVEQLDGVRSTYTVIDHPGAAVILPMHSDGDLILIKQWRHAPQAEIFEFPAGTLESGESPIDCAKREVVEETSYMAKEWISLGELLPTPGFANERQYLYLARDLAPLDGKMDDDEIIDVFKFPQNEVVQMVRDGRLLDGKSLSILLRAIVMGYVRA